MPPQISPGSVAEAQFGNQSRILQTSMLQIRGRFCMAVELHLKKGDGPVE